MQIRVSLLPVLAVLLTAGSMAQPQPSAPRPKQRPEAIQAIVDAASGAPAELGSHLLLRLVEAGLVKDPEWRAELLDRAFRMAAGAKHPLRIAGAMHTDSDIGVLYAALEPGLDQLSLRCRAVGQMLAIVLLKAGFIWLRSKGSHRIYARGGGTVTSCPY